MVFPIAGGTQATGDFITNSVRFDNNANYLYADRFGTPTNADKYTISFWIKRCSQGQVDQLIKYNYGNGNRGFVITLRSDDALRWEEFTAAVATQLDIKTNRLFRDPSAWYHIVVAYDSTQGTASNRAKLYINGVQETSLATSTYVDQNFDGFLGTTPNNNKGFIIGSYWNSSGGIDSASYTDGYMADFYLTDGYAYAASDFGETNDNGVWVPKEADVSFGTNGFHLEFKQTGTSANASGIGADTSGNDNHFSVGNITAIDVTTDTPQNNFATLNPLNSSASVALSEGNTKHTNSGANDQASAATMGFANGKWYWEVKCVDKGEVGINLDSDILQLANDSAVGSNDANIKATSLITNSAGGSNDFRFNGGTETVSSSSVANNDILMVAVDADNTKIYFGVNGTWMNSGDPAGGTGELKNFSSGYTAGNFITPVGVVATGDGDILEYNFGNAPFSISSGNSDANGYGNFEYAVPSGYHALCTKNLAEYG